MHVLPFGKLGAVHLILLLALQTLGLNTAAATKFLIKLSRRAVYAAVDIVSKKWAPRRACQESLRSLSSALLLQSPCASFRSMIRVGSQRCMFACTGGRLEPSMLRLNPARICTGRRQPTSTLLRSATSEAKQSKAYKRQAPGFKHGTASFMVVKPARQLVWCV